MKYHPLIILFGLTIATVCPAQDPPELADLRGKYLEALKTTREGIATKYVSQMEDMLAESTQAGRLEEALAVRSAIRSMQESGTPDPVVATNDKPERPEGERPDRGKPDFGRPDRSEDDEKGDISARPGTITLKAEDASLEGALKHFRGYIVNWIRPNCRARWHSRDVPAGKYDVFFVYSASYGQGGVIEVKDFGYVFDAKIERTDWRDAERVKVGTIETRGGIGMQLTPKTISEEGVLNLREIHLVPVK